MPLPVMSISQGSEDLQLDTSLQHLEEDEAEEDQERRNKEVLNLFHSKCKSSATSDRQIKNMVFWEVILSCVVNIYR